MVKIQVCGLALLAFASTAFGAAQTSGAAKVAVMNIQGALVSTKDGQKAAAELESKSAPKRKALEQKQNELNALKDQLQKGQNTLSEAAKQELYRNIDTKTKSLQRDMEDAEADFNNDQRRVLDDLGQRMMAVIDKYAKDNGYTLILDVSNPQTPVLYASNTIDITKEIIDLYDKNAPSTVAPSTGAPARPAPGSSMQPTRPSGVPPAPGVSRPAAPKPGTTR